MRADANALRCPAAARRRHAQSARNADLTAAIEPLRAPGYASPSANAARDTDSELAELLMAARSCETKGLRH